MQDEVDGVLYDPIPPCDYMLLPEPSEVREHADEAMAAAAVLRPGSDVFDALCRVFAQELSDTGLIDALVTIDRLKAHLDARQAQLRTELARRDPDGQEFLQDEVACALQVAPGTAAQRIEVAQQLTGRLGETFELIRTGRTSWAHGKILATACHDLDDQVTAKVQERVLARVQVQTPGEFAASVRRRGTAPRSSGPPSPPAPSRQMRRMTGPRTSAGRTRSSRSHKPPWRTRTWSASTASAPRSTSRWLHQRWPAWTSSPG